MLGRYHLLKPQQLIPLLPTGRLSHSAKIKKKNEIKALLRENIGSGTAGTHLTWYQSCALLDFNERDKIPQHFQGHLYVVCNHKCSQYTTPKGFNHTISF